MCASRITALGFAILTSAALAFSQEIPLRDWRQVDTVETPGRSARWEVAGQTVRVSGPLISPSAGDRFRSFFVAGDPGTEECTFRCAFTREAVYDEQGLAKAPFGIVFRWRDAENYYAFLFDGEDGLHLRRTTHGDTVDLASCPGYAPIDVETYLDAQLGTDRIRIRLNGRLILEATDNTLPTGRVGFFVDRGAAICFDRVALYPEASAPFLYVPLLMLKLPYVVWTEADRAIIMWETNRPVSTEVIYGERGDEDAHSVSVTADSCLQRVVLAGLARNTQYVYRVKAEGRNRGGGEFHTHVTPEESVTVGFISDTRTYPEHFKQFAAMLLARQPNFLIHLGGLINHPARLDEWDELFFKPGEALFGRAPVYVAPGNHDQSPNRRWLNAYLPYPGIGLERDSRGESVYYAFHYGNAAFAILDNYFSLAPGSPQYQWLQETLRSPAFQNALWRIVCCHEPPYGIERAQWKPGNTDMRDHVLPLCRKYGVQVLVAGHERTYKRTLVDGVILIVNGASAAGQDTRTRMGGPVAQFTDQLLGYASLQYGIMRFEGSRLEWTCYNSVNERIDRFRLEHGRITPVDALE